MTRYLLERVELGDPQIAPMMWEFAGVKVRGTEYRYPVTDRNHGTRNRWEFVVRVPNDPYGRIEVRPVKVPNDKALAGLDRRSLTFMRGTLGRYTQYRYCQLSFAKPSGHGTRRVVNWSQKHRLPTWLRRLRLKRKSDVRSTRGTDGNSVAVLIRPDDYGAMIGLFLASKAWILKQGFTLD